MHGLLQQNPPKQSAWTSKVLFEIQDIQKALRKKLYYPVLQSKTPETNFAIAAPSEAIGGIGLEFMDDVHYQTAELGYWIGEDYWRRGIMTAAVTVFTEYAFKNYELIRIFAAVFESNPASVRVLEKAGYTFEGRLRRSANKNRKILDQLMYAKVK